MATSLARARWALRRVRMLSYFEMRLAARLRRHFLDEAHRVAAAYETHGQIGAMLAIDTTKGLVSRAVIGLATTAALRAGQDVLDVMGRKSAYLDDHNVDNDEETGQFVAAGSTSQPATGIGSREGVPGNEIPTPKRRYKTIDEVSQDVPKGLNQRLGNCYELAVHRVMYQPMPSIVRLVHGHIRTADDDAGGVAHAWVEKGDTIFDAVLGVAFHKDDYNRIMNAETWARYTPSQAMKIMFKSSNYGPWDEKSMAWYATRNIPPETPTKKPSKKEGDDARDISKVVSTPGVPLPPDLLAKLSNKSAYLDAHNVENDTETGQFTGMSGPASGIDNYESSTPYTTEQERLSERRNETFKRFREVYPNARIETTVGTTADTIEFVDTLNTLGQLNPDTAQRITQINAFPGAIRGNTALNAPGCAGVCCTKISPGAEPEITLHFEPLGKAEGYSGLTHSESVRQVIAHEFGHAVVSGVETVEAGKALVARQGESVQKMAEDWSDQGFFYYATHNLPSAERDVERLNVFSTIRLAESMRHVDALKISRMTFDSVEKRIEYVAAHDSRPTNYALTDNGEMFAEIFGFLHLGRMDRIPEGGALAVRKYASKVRPYVSKPKSKEESFTVIIKDDFDETFHPARTDDEILRDMIASGFKESAYLDAHNVENDPASGQFTSAGTGGSTEWRESDPVPHVMSDEFSAQAEAGRFEGWDASELAARAYGVTESLDAAGFILPDGTMLDLSEEGGDGMRTIDHHTIIHVYEAIAPNDKSWSERVNDRDPSNRAITKFENEERAIRFQYSKDNYNASMVHEPSSRQLAILKDCEELTVTGGYFDRKGTEGQSVRSTTTEGGDKYNVDRAMNFLFRGDADEGKESTYLDEHNVENDPASGQFISAGTGVAPLYDPVEGRFKIPESVIQTENYIPGVGDDEETFEEASAREERERLSDLRDNLQTLSSDAPTIGKVLAEYDAEHGKSLVDGDVDDSTGLAREVEDDLRKNGIPSDEVHLLTQVANAWVGYGVSHEIKDRAVYMLRSKEEFDPREINPSLRPEDLSVTVCADALLRLTARAEGVDYPLYRGMKLRDYEAEQMLQVGGTISDPIGAWSSREPLAQLFSQNPDTSGRTPIEEVGKVSVVLHGENIAGVHISQLTSDATTSRALLYTAEEHIAGGSFKVLSVETVYAPRREINPEVMKDRGGMGPTVATANLENSIRTIYVEVEQVEQTDYPPKQEKKEDAIPLPNYVPAGLPFPDWTRTPGVPKIKESAYLDAHNVENDTETGQFTSAGSTVVTDDANSAYSISIAKLREQDSELAKRLDAAQKRYAEVFHGTQAEVEEPSDVAVGIVTSMTRLGEQYPTVAACVDHVIVARTASEDEKNARATAYTTTDFPKGLDGPPSITMKFYADKIDDIFAESRGILPENAARYVAAHEFGHAVTATIESPSKLPELLAWDHAQHPLETLRDLSTFTSTQMASTMMSNLPSAGPDLNPRNNPFGLLRVQEGSSLLHMPRPSNYALKDNGEMFAEIFAYKSLGLSSRNPKGSGPVIKAYLAKSKFKPPRKENTEPCSVTIVDDFDNSPRPVLSDLEIMRRILAGTHKESDYLDAHNVDNSPEDGRFVAAGAGGAATTPAAAPSGALAPFLKLDIGKRREAFKALSIEERDKIANPEVSIRDTMREMLGDTEQPNTGDLAADLTARLGQFEDKILPEHMAMLEPRIQEYANALEYIGATPSEVRWLSMAVADHFIAQEMEATGRTLGDHGIRHLLGDADMAMDLMTTMPEGAKQFFEHDEPRLRVAMMTAAAFHDAAYLAPPSRVFLDEDHPRWSAQYFVSNGYQDALADVLGEKEAGVVTQMIASHAQTNLEWTSHSEVSAFRFADNLALFQGEKLPALIEKSHIAELTLARLAKGSITVDQAKATMRASVERLDVSPAVRGQLMRAVDEVSPILPKLTLGMIDADVSNLGWKQTGKDLYPVATIHRTGASAVADYVEMGQRQFSKLAETYGHTLDDFKSANNLKLADPDGKIVAEFIIRGKAIKELEWKDGEQPSRFVLAATRFVRQQALSQADGIALTAKKRLVRVITDGMTHGDSVDTIAGELEGALRALAPTRAYTIARTEIHRAASFASLTALDDMPDQESIINEWCCVWDERTRTSHEEADGQERSLGELFEVGDDMLEFPGDPNGSPEETINCRCQLLPRRV